MVLRNKRWANWCFRFIAQFKSQPSFLAPFPPIGLVVPQLSRVEVDQVLRMAKPQFDEVVRHRRLAEYRKTKAAERGVSALSPRLLQHIQNIARVQKTSRSRRE